MKKIISVLSLAAAGALSFGGPLASTQAVPTVRTGAKGPSAARAEAVPWSSVTRGWSYLTTTSPDPSATGRDTLRLVSPTGRSWSLGVLVHGTRVQDTSPDAARVLLAVPNGTRQTLQVLTPRKGCRTSVATLELGDARFTRPSGLNVLVQPLGQNSYSRHDLTGRRLATFVGTNGGRATQAQNGVEVFGTNAAKQLTISMNGSGRVAHTLNPPQGFSLCMVGGAFAADIVTYTCVRPNGNDSQVFLVRSNGQISPLTGSLPPAPFGYVAASPTVKGHAVWKGVGCGVSPLAHVGPDLELRDVAGVRKGESSVGVLDDDVLLLGGMRVCDPSPATTLRKLNVVTGASFGLFTAPSGQVIGSVVVAGL